MFNERYTQLLLPLILGVVLLTTGFYIGKSSNMDSPPLGVLNATTSDSVDMAAYWKAWKILEEKFAPASSTSLSISNQDKIWGSIEGLASSYNDPYTVFFPPAESKTFGEEISGSFGGVGMEIGVQDGLLTVISPIKGSPAYLAGVLPGDKVLEISGKSAIDMSSEEAVKLIRG